jgi:hypothetical protein
MRIDFLDPAQHPGLNSTVRLGERYIPLNTPLELCETGSEKVAYTGIVVGLYITTFKSLTRYDVQMQHAEDTQNLEGLWEAMIRAYGEKFDRESHVTVVYYIVDAIRIER